MKKRSTGAHKEYGWAEAREQLELGVHPGVVAARLGDSEANVLEVADQQGWPVSWRGQRPEQILDAALRELT